MTGVIGQRLLDAASTTEDSAAARYIKHPPNTDPWWGNGNPLDSGTAMLLDNNVHHLAHESMRHLVWDPGPGTVGAKFTGTGWESLRDDTIPANAGNEFAIAWDGRTARKYGPFFLIRDRVDTDGLPALRRVRVRITSSHTGGATYYFALTASPAPPTRGGYLAFATSTTSGTISLTLTPSGTGAEQAQPIACRVTSAGLSQIVTAQVYLWIGWYTPNAADGWHSLSAWEKP